MANTVFINKINEKITGLHSDENYAVILKGIPMQAVNADSDVSPLEVIVKNKFKYFASTFSKRNVYTFEEFLSLNSFIIDQYETIYILNNNVYMNYYPIDASFSDEVRSGLLAHFSESEDDNDETVIGNITEIIDLYDSIKDYHGVLIGAYCDDKIPNESKIKNINLFELSDCLIEKKNVENDTLVDAINDEGDYISLVKKVFDGADEIVIQTANFCGDKERLLSHITILSEYWSDYTDIYLAKYEDNALQYECREEFTAILQKYWGKDSFREIEFYDREALEKDNKETIVISQEQIISDLVCQVENCGNDDRVFHDVFVTAPTGAGKSVMFQIPAIYLAEKYNYLTIVISPLIGLMNDQVSGLEKRHYEGAKTINSDINPIVKDDILNKIADSEYHILYLSPETLLARSTVEQLIGDRVIGMIIIDEAHIVTTWGKQFRPDYWYLGEHIRKLRTKQMKKTGRSFIIGTFTATAIYRGIEDMYEETKNSLQMINPSTYLGYIKRNDIDIVIKTTKKTTGTQTNYRPEKLDKLEEVIKRAKITGKKTLVYFPTIALIDECYQYFENKKMVADIAKYHGALQKDQKEESYNSFLNGEKSIMFATKAFGMGIDIDNIELVAHYAPTGNVCDYVQEIGRAARRNDLKGEAFYNYDRRDFMFINRLHGLSSIKKYQLIEVCKKLVELYDMNALHRSGAVITKKSNAMLVDAKNFTYIFERPTGDVDDSTNKVKTALLILQKDFESIFTYSPVTVRPIPLFSSGFFSISPETQALLKKKYGKCIEEINASKHICRVNLESIWQVECKEKSFPQFKYLLYSRSNELGFNSKYTLLPAMCVALEYSDDYLSRFSNVMTVLKRTINDSVITQEYLSADQLADILQNKCGYRKYKAQTICEVLLASMEVYCRDFSKGIHSLYKPRDLNNGERKYQFKTAVNTYFSWLEKVFKSIRDENKGGELFIVNTEGKNSREYATVLGLLEALDIMSFEMTGGADSQLYIYINQIRRIKDIVNEPWKYNNRLLESVAEKHLISVKMLTYIYEGEFSSEEIWDILENYFLGIIPAKVKADCLKERPDMRFER